MSACILCSAALAGKATKYCSNKCKVADWKAVHAARVLEFRSRERERAAPRFRMLKACVTCGALGRFLRCAPCGAALARSKEFESNLLAHRAAKNGILCADCGIAFSALYGAKLRSICPSCQDLRYAAYRRADRAARKARKRVATIERFDDLEVLARDGWRCQLCGVETPSAMRGTREPNAPEVDHITPLSKGGPHARTNVQCACRSCNAWKSDRIVVGQLSLQIN